MGADKAPGYHQAVAEQNVTAILDAATELLEQQAQVSVSAVAKHAGVSRVTVYAHFPTWEALLAAAVERAVRQTMAELAATHPEQGPPAEALERTITHAWRYLARYGAMAQAVAEQLTPDAVARTHRAAHQMLGALLERGRADGSFRADLPAGWLVTAAIALIHACAAEVRAGRIAEHEATAILAATIRDLFTGPGGR
jgi:TetR/AcrR family transcriptional repressor of mexCD-oprJ operon